MGKLNLDGYSTRAIHENFITWFAVYCMLYDILSTLTVWSSYSVYLSLFALKMCNF